MNQELGFVHRFVPGTSGRTLLLLHGTGGNEEDLLPIGRAMDPHASLLSPRGKVLENGMPRFFRRLAEGVFDEADLVLRVGELAEFVGRSAERYGLDAEKVVAVGYSNGANIAGGLLLLRPEVLSGAVLLRPMVPLVPEPLPVLGGVPALICTGIHDPIVPPENARALVRLLSDSGAALTVVNEDAGHGLTEATLGHAHRWLVERALHGQNA